MAIQPKEALLEGARILDRVLVPKGFVFRLKGEGKGSGGNAAWGEFVREDRLLELHFRWSLGLVRYHVGNKSASHEFYMRELGVFNQCRYPGFSENPLQAFRELAHDVSLAQDFLGGTAAKLRQAAAKEAAHAKRQNEALLPRYAGDTRKLNEMRTNFREKRYRRVVKLARGLKYPRRMTESERKMLEIAHKRSGIFWRLSHWRPATA
jgi:hypothetical protein